MVLHYVKMTVTHSHPSEGSPGGATAKSPFILYTMSTSVLSLFLILPKSHYELLYINAHLALKTQHHMDDPKGSFCSSTTPGVTTHCQTQGGSHYHWRVACELEVTWEGKTHPSLPFWSSSQMEWYLKALLYATVSIRVIKDVSVLLYFRAAKAWMMFLDQSLMLWCCDHPSSCPPDLHSPSVVCY